ncbi:MAG: sulfatase-like hydrolase/transferase [Myxococcales bacterium]|nr:sulfatase-like hydrolase/transferase [Myxococcales bacterium]
MRRAGHRGEASAGAPASLRRALALLAVGCAAKLVLVGLRAHDGEAGGLFGPWGPPTLLYQELWAALGLYGLDRALLSLGTWLKRPVLADRFCWGLYGLLAAYTAINVPIARQFSTPLTYAFVEAAGAALRDSITQYATPGNLAALLGLLVWALVVPRLVRAPRGAWRWAGAGLAALVLVLGPIGAARSETLGLHRNAAVTLLRTTWARFGPRPAAPRTATTLTPEGPALDLSYLSGAARGYHVIWVILESTGARHLALYGAPGDDPTPRLSALARDGLIFERMYTSDPESIKSLLPILCGAYPAAHSSGEDYAAGGPACAALPAALRAAGYRTGLFHSGRFMYLGMQAMVEGRGFEVLADAAEIGGPYAASFGTDDRSTARRVLEFLDDAPAGRPVFALYMPIAGHHPYRAPGSGTRPFAARSEAEHHRNDLYVGDEALGELIDGVRARGLMERTLWIVMGDHGEAFHEHPGNFAHSLFVYEENVHIPAVIVVPGALRQALRVPQVGGTIDLAPTLLELLGLPVIGGGRSLLRGEPGVARFFTDHSALLLGLRQDRWKCIVEPEAGRVRLFDLEVDPGETNDVAAQEPARAERYRAALMAWSAEQSARRE